MWSLPDHKPIGHNLPYKGGVTRHFGCRSTEQGVLRTPEALKRRGIDLSNVEGAQRASMLGQVPGNWNYYDWLSRQPESVQRQVLGKKAFEMMKSGKVSAETAVRMVTPKLLEEQDLERLRLGYLQT